MDILLFCVHCKEVLIKLFQKFAPSRARALVALRRARNKTSACLFSLRLHFAKKKATEKFLFTSS